MGRRRATLSAPAAVWTNHAAAQRAPAVPRQSQDWAWHQSTLRSGGACVYLSQSRPSTRVNFRRCALLLQSMAFGGRTGRLHPHSPRLLGGVLFHFLKRGGGSWPGEVLSSGWVGAVAIAGPRQGRREGEGRVGRGSRVAFQRSRNGPCDLRGALFHSEAKPEPSQTSPGFRENFRHPPPPHFFYCLVRDGC